MSKIYKNGLFKKKSVQKSKNPYFWKNPYKNGFKKNPYLYGQIRTSGNTDPYSLRQGDAPWGGILFCSSMHIFFIDTTYRYCWWYVTSYSFYLVLTDFKLFTGCDTNSRQTVWGSLDVNSRGEDLCKYLMAQELLVLNKGKTPTFVTSVGQEILDLTIYSLGLQRLVWGWVTLVWESAWNFKKLFEKILGTNKHSINSETLWWSFNFFKIYLEKFLEDQRKCRRNCYGYLLGVLRNFFWPKGSFEYSTSLISVPFVLMHIRQLEEKFFLD